MDNRSNPAVTPDQALEHIIAELTAAIAVTGDSRFAMLQKLAVSLRTKGQVNKMEREQGLARGSA